MILTDPIPNKKFVGLANQRIIYQEYTIDYAEQVSEIYSLGRRILPEHFQEKDKNKRQQKPNYGLSKDILDRKMMKINRLKPEVRKKYFVH